jgi:hypothetical protein
MTMQQDSTRAESAFVLMLLQATFWAMAGLSALPFVLGGEIVMVGLAALSIAFAGGAVILAIGVVQRRRRARRWTLVLEGICFAGALLQLALPLGTNRGPVALLVNVALPAAVVLLLRGKRMRAQFGITSAAHQ